MRLIAIILILTSCAPLPEVIWPEANIAKIVIPPRVLQQFESEGIIWVTEYTKRVEVSLYLVQYEDGIRKLYLVTYMAFDNLKKGEYYNPLILVVFYIKGLPDGEYEILVRASNRYRQSERRSRFISVQDDVQPRYIP